jgi:hypothetical protein
MVIILIVISNNSKCNVVEESTTMNEKNTFIMQITRVKNWYNVQDEDTAKRMA